MAQAVVDYAPGPYDDAIVSAERWNTEEAPVFDIDFLGSLVPGS